MDHLCTKDRELNLIISKIDSLEVEVKETRTDIRSLLQFKWKVSGYSIAFCTIAGLIGSFTGWIISVGLVEMIQKSL